MTKALKVLVIIYSVVIVVFGLLFVIAPEQSLKMMGMNGLTDTVKFLMAGEGVTLVSIGVWGIVAGRDVLRNLIVLKLLTTTALLTLASYIGSVIAGYVEFSNVVLGILLDGGFGILTPGFLSLEGKTDRRTGQESDVGRASSWRSY